MPLESSSSFRRYGQRDDRRRRLLTDELSNPGDRPSCRVWPENAPPAQKSEHYGDAEFLEQQLRLLDLVPRGLVGHLLLLAAGAGIFVAIEAAYAWMLDRAANGAAAIAALDLAAKGSLGCWFSSLMLLAASAAAILVYTVRRHRTDDYQGRYRIWLWAAACCFVVAADRAASLREGFRDLMTALTGTPLVGDGTLWWSILYAFVLGAVGSRLAIDMRRCGLSLGVLLAAAVAQSLSVAGRLGWILPVGGLRDAMFLTGAEMVGDLLLLSAMALHARHVILDAEGLLPRSEPRPADDLDEESTDHQAEPPASSGSRWTKVDQPHPVPPPAFRRAASEPVSSSIAAASASVHRKLTKAERKALKERLLRERLERQGRG